MQRCSTSTLAAGAQPYTRPTSIYKMLLPISSICEAKLLLVYSPDGHSFSRHSLRRQSLYNSYLYFIAAAAKKNKQNYLSCTAPDKGKIKCHLLRRTETFCSQTENANSPRCEIRNTCPSKLRAELIAAKGAGDFNWRKEQNVIGSFG